MNINYLAGFNQFHAKSTCSPNTHTYISSQNQIQLNENLIYEAEAEEEVKQSNQRSNKLIIIKKY